MPTFLVNLFSEISADVIAYDCTQKNLKYEKLSLPSDLNCTITDKEIIPDQAFVQLLELTDTFSIQTYHCKISVLRTVTVCGGWGSYASVVPGGISQYVQEISRDQCIDIINTGNYKFSNNVQINDIKLDVVKSHSTVLAGTSKTSGNCKGASFSDGAGSWDDVVVIAEIKILVKSSESVVDLNNNKLALSSGEVCIYNWRSCVTDTLGQSFWTMASNDSCSNNRHIIHYTGESKRFEYITDQPRTELNKTSYFIETNNKVIWIDTTTMFNLCGYRAWKTEHPKLIIIESSVGKYPFSDEYKHSSSIDMFLYINTKFVTYDKHVSQQLTSLYRNIMVNKCYNDRQLLHSLMTTAMTEPDLFAIEYKKSVGYTSYRRNEVIYVVKCQAVEVEWDYTQIKCFDELPVIYNNRSMFMRPRTKLLQTIGTEINCGTIFDGGFKLNDVWYSFNPHRGYTKVPEDLQIDGNTKWTYKSLDVLAIKGLYTSEELEKYKFDIMYHNIQKSVSNILTRDSMGYHSDHQGINPVNIFTELDITKITNRVVGKVWWFASVLGESIVGFTGLYAIYVIIKITLEVLIRAFNLYKVFGLSLYLLAAVWHVLTTYVLSQSNQTVFVATDEKEKYSEKNNKKEEILLNIKTSERSSCNIDIHSDANDTLPSTKMSSFYPKLPMV